MKRLYGQGKSMEELLRIAYCEDESIQIERMGALIKNWALDNKCNYIFQGYKSGESFFFENDRSYPFDLLFVDIEMNEMNGMTVAKKIRETDEDIELVFLTNRKEFVFEGYEVQALRYCVKPLDEAKLEDILQDISIRKKKEKYYLIDKQDGETRKVDFSQVIYMETNGHYINIHTKKEHYVFKKSLQEIIEFIIKKEDGIEQGGFIITHRSFLVNLKFVDCIKKTECILDNGNSIPISRNSYKKVNDAFINYYK